MLLRRWLDAADMRVDDLLKVWRPEHFTDGRVPAKSTVSQRLAGVGLKRDFVEAVADACSHDDVGRTRLLREVEDLQKRAASRPAAGGAEKDSGSELVRVQQRSLDLSDRLMRAMERATELERERNSANHMVLLLLTMVDGLQRNISALNRERDRLRTAVSEQAAQVRARLERSEQQRTTAEAELDRALSERHKADRLFEEAAERVRALTEELEVLRGEVPRDDDDAAAAPPTRFQEVFDAPADDIDVALAKAARHLDDGADRLERLADELHLDNLADNSPASDNPANNPSSATASHDTVADIKYRRSEGSDVAETLSRAAREQHPNDVLATVEGLRTAGYDADADRLMENVGSIRDIKDMHLLIAKMRADERHDDVGQLLTAVGRTRPPDEILHAVSELREAGHHSEGYQVLAAVGRIRPLIEVPSILSVAEHRDAQWILEVAIRERPRDDIATLHDALESLGKPTEDLLAYTAAAHPLSHEALSDDEDEEEDLRFQTYHTGKPPLPRRRPNEEVYKQRKEDPRFYDPNFSPVDSVVTNKADGLTLLNLHPQHQRICRLCREPKTIIEIAEALAIPLTVAQILVMEIGDIGAISINDPRKEDQHLRTPPDMPA